MRLRRQRLHSGEKRRAALTLHFLLRAKLRPVKPIRRAATHEGMQPLCGAALMCTAAKSVPGVGRRPVKALRRDGRAGAVLLAALALGVRGLGPARRGRDLFEALFGGMFHRRAPAPLPRKQFLRRPARPAAPAPVRRGRGFGHGIAYCVRLCDGRYFPIQRHAGASPAELCHSFCPAAKTTVFSGSKIDTAVGRRRALRRSRQRIRLSRERRRTAPATARMASASRTSN